MVIKDTDLVRVSNSEMANVLFVKKLKKDIIQLRIDYNDNEEIALGNKYRPAFLKKMDQHTNRNMNKK